MLMRVWPNIEQFPHEWYVDVAELYLYFSSAHLPAMHVKEQAATVAACRKNNYSDHS